MPPIEVTSPADIGRLVRATRKQSRGLRQDRAAALCEVSLPVLNKIERGAGEVWLSSLIKTCAGLGMRLYLEMPDAPTPPAGAPAETSSD